MMSYYKVKDNLIGEIKEKKDLLISREYDVIIYGATGFTGKLACEYIIKQYGIPLCVVDLNKNADSATQQAAVTDSFSFSSIKYAFAGRNKKKLEELKEDLAYSLNEESIKNIDIIVADTNDNLSLREMCVRTQVLLNLAGPFLKYGEYVVRACIESNTNYCDITGEVLFVKKIQRLYGKIAEDKKLKIVHFCGFDSVPSDMGTMLVQNEAIKKFNTPCNLIRFRFTQLQGGISGGTISSAVNMYNAINAEEKQQLSDPFYLCDKFVNNKNIIVDVIRSPQPKLKIIEYEDDVGYVTDFIMAKVNAKVVRWTNHKLEYKYGKDFRYSEAFSRKNFNILTTFLLNFFMRFGIKLLLFPPIFYILSKTLLPKPGCGPSPKKLREGFFFAKIIGDLHDAKNEKQQIIAIVGSDKGDPGYTETSKMLVECGLCIALEKDKCTELYGVLTPCSAIGMILIERLKHRGMIFKIVDNNNHYDDEIYNGAHNLVEK